MPANCVGSRSAWRPAYSLGYLLWNGDSERGRDYPTDWQARDAAVNTLAKRPDVVAVTVTSRDHRAIAVYERDLREAFNNEVAIMAKELQQFGLTPELALASAQRSVRRRWESNR